MVNISGPHTTLGAAVQIEPSLKVVMDRGGGRVDCGRFPWYLPRESKRGILVEFISILGGSGV